MKQKIEISYKTILFTFFCLLSLWFLYNIRSIIILTFFSMLLAVVIAPFVNKLEKIKIPRAVSILLVYLILIGLLSIVASFLIPALIQQTTVLIKNISIPEEWKSLIQVDWMTISNQLTAISENVVGFVRLVASAASNIINILAFLVLTFYMTYEKKNLDKYLGDFFGPSKKQTIINIIKSLDERLGGWMRGQVLLMLIVGSVSYLGLLLLGVNYALPLAIMAGFLEFIPNLGPTIALVPAVLVAWTISPVTALGTFILYFFIQQFENYIIVPQIMRKAVGIHPLVSLLLLLIGSKVYGVVGLLLAIPVFITLQTIVREVYFREN